MVFLELYVTGGQDSEAKVPCLLCRGQHCVCVRVLVCTQAHGCVVEEGHGLCVDRTCVFLCVLVAFWGHAAGLSVHFLCVIYKHTCNCMFMYQA